jgi:redox-sensing transcriptional repressor
MNNENLFTSKQARRFPLYIRYLKALQNAGETRTTIENIAATFDLAQSDVNADFELIYSEEQATLLTIDISETIKRISNILNYDVKKNVILIGVGKMGQSLINYEPFKELGFNIVACFDSNKNVIGQTFNNLKVCAYDDLKTMFKDLDAEIAILTVPTIVGQKSADDLVSLGIRAIWNFVPIPLSVPRNVIVENVYLGSSLALLNHRLVLQKEKESKK